MKVKELIEKLRKLNPEAVVVVCAEPPDGDTDARMMKAAKLVSGKRIEDCIGGPNGFMSDEEWKRESVLWKKHKDEPPDILNEAIYIEGEEME